MTLDRTNFAAVVAAAKSKTNDPKWRRAIDRAASAILAGELIVTTPSHSSSPQRQSPKNKNARTVDVLDVLFGRSRTLFKLLRARQRFTN